MARRFRKIPQPPIDRRGRPSESRGPWWGLALLTAAVLITALGAMLARDFRDATGVREWRAIRSITTGDPRAILATDDERAASADEPNDRDEDETPAVDTPGATDDFCPT